MTVREPASEPWHGTTGGYSNHHCRGPKCREAWTIYLREYRVRIQSRDVPEHVHGTNNGYSNYGCRCDLCSAAHRHAKQLYRTGISA